VRYIAVTNSEIENLWIEAWSKLIEIVTAKSGK